MKTNLTLKVLVNLVCKFSKLYQKLMIQSFLIDWEELEIMEFIVKGELSY